MAIDARMEEFRRTLSGDAHVPGDRGYDEARITFRFNHNIPPTEG